MKRRCLYPFCFGRVGCFVALFALILWVPIGVASDMQVTCVTPQVSSLPCGDELPVRVCIQNNGAATTGQVSVTIYLRRTCSGGTSYVIGTFNTGFWGSGDAGSYTARPTLPCSSLINGCFRVIAVLNVSDDTNNSNNSLCSSSQICVEEPQVTDAAVTDISFSPSSPAVGQTVQMTIAIKNNGNTTITDVDLEYRMDGLLLQPFGDTTAMNPGETYYDTIDWVVTSSGTHEFCAVITNVDPNDMVASNDSRCESFTSPLPPYDLAAISVEPNSPGGAYAIGDTVPIQATVSNVGGQTSPTYTASFTLQPGGFSLGSQSRSAITGGASSSFSMSGLIPAGEPAGTYTIRMTVSPGGDTSGNDADTSVGTIMIQPDLPSDLAVNSVEPANPGGEYQPGDAVPIIAAVMNIGDLASPAYSATFRLVEAGVDLCTENRASVASGSTDTFGASCVIPAGIAPGTYHIMLTAAASGDPGGNNTLTSTGTIRLPDITGVLEDDFQDGTPEPNWSVYSQNSQLINASEQNGHLELVGNVNLGALVAAGFVGETWAIDTTTDWSFQIAWRFIAPSIFEGGEAGLALAVALEGDPLPLVMYDGVILSIGRVATAQGPVDYYLSRVVRNGVDPGPSQFGRPVDSGTVTVSYDQSLDTLSVQAPGLTGQLDIPQFVSGGSGSNTAQLFFGGYTEGPVDTFSGANTWFDDFVVTEGLIVSGTQPCNPADLVEPFGILDLGDIIEFIVQFGVQGAAADICAPSGIWDLADILGFVQHHQGGCDFQSGCP